MRDDKVLGLVLHIRPYRETSAILQLFTRQYGRLSTVMRGWRGRKRQPTVQPFTLGSVGLTGRGDMLNVMRFDAQRHWLLERDAIPAGFYVAELLLRTLAEKQPEQVIFDATTATFDALVQHTNDVVEIGVQLRRFENLLLQELGFGLNFISDAIDGRSIESDKRYRFVEEAGFALQDERTPAAPGDLTLDGWVIQAIASEDYSEAKVRKTARLVLQQALLPLLGHRPIQSRALLGLPASTIADHD